MKRGIHCLFLIAIFSCTDKNEHHTITPGLNNADSFVGPKVTVLANLPDSLRPKTTMLDTMPRPLTVAIPTHIGGSYSASGSAVAIALAPPVVNPLPVLHQAKGEVVHDAAGNPFIMGDGGRSHFTTFTTDDGLALDAVKCSYTDQAGNLWFGTQGGGLSRYDGKSFVTFSMAHGLANNHVLSIVEDRKGNLWFGTQGGLSRYDGKAFVTFSTAQGLANNIVASIAEDRKGNLWFGTRGGGVSRYNGKTFTTYSTAQGLANNIVASICEDQNGNIWFGTQGGGLSRYDGKSFTSFTTAQGLANNMVFSIAEDPNGDLWFGTYGGGLSRYNGRSFTTYSTAQGLANNMVFSIAEDHKGNLWFGTQGGGISRYDGKTFTTYSTAQGLAHNNVTSVTRDRSGSLWFSTFGGGLSRYDGKSFVSFTTAHGLANNMVFSIAEDRRGDLWFGTFGGGLSRYNGKSFTTYSTAQGLANNNVLCFAEDRAGNLWSGTQGGGVSRYDGKSFTSFSTAQGLANNNIYSIAEDRTGNLWFGTYGAGLSRYDGKSFTTFSTAQGLAHNIVVSIAEDRSGNLWIGTQGGGISRYDGKSFTTFSRDQGLANNNVYCIVTDAAGNLWLGTEEGLCVIPEKYLNGIGTPEKNNTAQPARGNHVKAGTFLKTFTKSDGLPDNYITQVLQLPDGRMAVGTNLGITIFRLSADFSSLNDIKIYNTNTGYPVKDVNIGHNCLFFDSRGIIWASTGSEKTALVRFDPAALRQHNEPPTLIINGIRVNDENIVWNNLIRTKDNDSGDQEIATGVTPAHVTEEAVIHGRALTAAERDSMRKKFEGISFDSIARYYPIPQHLVLPYHQNHIAIDFHALETGKPDLVNYQYILEGYDKAWSPVLKKTSADFGNIREGSYTFKVKAQGPNGVWCAPITYSFKVLPPWYRTWWAYLIYGLLTLGALIIFSKLRERNLRRDKASLERKVHERTEVIEEQKAELVIKNRIAEEQKAVVEQERQRSETLLLNILPEEVAAELKSTGLAKAKQFNHITVMFTDFVNFTRAGERMSPQALIDELHACFKAFDEITVRYGIEKIKTIGDAYLAVAGLPVSNPDHALLTVQAAIEINAFTQQRIAKLGSNTFQIRIGVHSGPVIAGIVGVKKFAYDIWGDTVNTAARVEQSSKAGKINISQTTYELVKDRVNCVDRGEIGAKHKGQIKMYFVEGMK